MRCAVVWTVYVSTLFDVDVVEGGEIKSFVYVEFEQAQAPALHYKYIIQERILYDENKLSQYIPCN